MLSDKNTAQGYNLGLCEKYKTVTGQRKIQIFVEISFQDGKLMQQQNMMLKMLGYQRIQISGHYFLCHNKINHLLCG